MNDFDARAREWDKDKMHTERSVAIAAAIEKSIPLNKSMKALEYGAGTGILSFVLKDKFSEIILMDSSKEMIKVCEEKAAYHNTNNIKPLWFDLEHSEYNEPVDILYNQMVLHHVSDVDLIFQKFYNLITPGGYLAIADLYTEDGSFHGAGANVHLGFDPEELSKSLKNIGFLTIEYFTCFNIKRDSGAIFPVFLIIAKK